MNQGAFMKKLLIVGFGLLAVNGAWASAEKKEEGEKLFTDEELTKMTVIEPTTGKRMSALELLNTKTYENFYDKQVKEDGWQEPNKNMIIVKLGYHWVQLYSFARGDIVLVARTSQKYERGSSYGIIYNVKHKLRDQATQKEIITTKLSDYDLTKFQYLTELYDIQIPGGQKDNLNTSSFREWRFKLQTSK
jgi:hypothetical protein